MNCSPCSERGVTTSVAARMVAGTPMCENCFHGKPVPQQKQRWKFEPRPLVASNGPLRPIDVGFAVNILRQARGLTQQDVAKRLGVQRTFISKIENCNCVPTISSIEALAKALDVTPYVLIVFATFSSYYKETIAPAKVAA